MIVATAGHVDHGKTTLVRALTGIDTDRLPEERRRGMTIEPGFAHADIGGGRVVSFVDVPGHADYLRQAIAGLDGAEAALLVVACDDGPMPQTREHLALLQWLGIGHLALVLSKVDRVPAEHVKSVGETVRTMLGPTPYAKAPLLPCCAADGRGLSAVRSWLAEQSAATPAPALSPAPGPGFRLWVDRSFTRDGVGTVVTGTVRSGRVRVGDTLVLSSSGTAVRVRALQGQGHAVESLGPGQRAALALAGVAREAVNRGDQLLAPWLHAPTLRLDARVQVSADASRALDGRGELQLHLGTSCLPARVVALQGPRIEPGGQGVVQLLLRSPVGALHGDRLVLRDAAAHAVVGGGHVLDPLPPQRGRSTPARQAEWPALDEPDAVRAARHLAVLRPNGVDLTAWARQRNVDAADLARRAADDTVQVLAVRGAPRLVARTRWEAWCAAVPRVVAAWHVARPAAQGLGDEALRREWRDQTRGTVDDKLIRLAVQSALDAGTVQRVGFVLCRPGHRPVLALDDESALQRVRQVLQPLGLRPPPLGDLAAMMDQPVPQAAAALERLAALGHIVQVARNRFFLPENLLALMTVARAVAAAAPDGRFDAAAFRDRSGVGRNLSIQLLEYFDRVRFTRFRELRREIVDPEA